MPSEITQVEGSSLSGVGVDVGVGLADGMVAVGSASGVVVQPVTRAVVSSNRPVDAVSRIYLSS